MNEDFQMSTLAAYTFLLPLLNDRKHLPALDLVTEERFGKFESCPHDERQIH